MKSARLGLASSSEKALSSETLRARLRALELPPRVDGVLMLDGCLTTIIIGLDSFSPTEWFVDLLGQHGGVSPPPQARHWPQCKRLLRASMRSANSSPSHRTDTRRSSRRWTTAPCWRPPECMGFLAAMQLRGKDWAALRDLRRIARGLLLPILLNCTDAHGNPMLGVPRDGTVLHGSGVRLRYSRPGLGS
jgi:hypothetical protein